MTVTSRISCGGSFWPSRILSKHLLGGVALAALFVGTVQANADESTAELAAEIRALKAQLHHLESKVEKQHVQIRAVEAQATAPGRGPGPYEPPVPWDKKFHLNGITITPGGFIAAEGVWRSRAEGADIGDLPFGSTPFPNGPIAHTNELRFSARQSRMSLLVQGNYNPDVLVSGYGELDFLGAGNTANSNESNSYNPRIRHMYATIDWLGEGFHILAGQTWSLATLQGKGISPRNELIPATIDAQYVAGFVWARQPGFRITKNFGEDFWVAASAEMPQTEGSCPSLPGSATSFPPSGSPPVTTGLPAGVVSLTCSQESGGGGLLNQFTTYSLNHIPDIIAKAAWEPNLAGHKVHLEGFGMYRDFYDRVEYGSFGDNTHNRDSAGWGVGGSAVVQVVPKLLDIQGSVLFGRGIGRYGSGQLSDATFNNDDSLRPLPELMLMAGATVHATPQLDIYGYGGMERILSSEYFNTATGTSGYGQAGAINSGCGVEFSAGSLCAGNTRDVWEVTGGFWDKVYEGAFGQVKVGMQYEFIKRELFPGAGSGGGFPAFAGSPATTENVVLSSVRYYPFEAPPVAPPLVAKY